MRQDSNTMSGMAFTTGVLAGLALSFFIPNEKSKEIKNKLSQKAKEFSENFEEGVGLSQLKNSFSQVSNDIMDNYQTARKNLMKELRSTAQNWDEIDKRKYSTAVKNVLTRLQEDQELDDQSVSAIKNYLESDFQTFRAQWR